MKIKTSRGYKKKKYRDKIMIKNFFMKDDLGILTTKKIGEFRQHLINKHYSNNKIETIVFFDKYFIKNIHTFYDEQEIEKLTYKKLQNSIIEYLRNKNEIDESIFF